MCNAKGKKCRQRTHWWWLQNPKTRHKKENILILVHNRRLFAQCFYACFHFNKVIIAVDSCMFYGICVCTCWRWPHEFRVHLIYLLETWDRFSIDLQVLEEYQIIRHAPFSVRFFFVWLQMPCRKTIFNLWVQLNWILHLTEVSFFFLGDWNACGQFAVEQSISRFCSPFGSQGVLYANIWNCANIVFLICSTGHWCVW